MRRFFVSTFLIILLLSPSSLCPTLAYTGNAPENSTQTLDIQLNQTGTPDTDLNKTQPDIEEVPPPVIEAYASPTQGSSPLVVTFTGVVHSRVGAVLIYKWDFDGDGLTDYASGDSGNTSHAYTVSSPKKCQARFTVVYRDGTEVQETVTVTVEPVRKSDWHEIRDLGLTVFGLHTNGTIYLYDETSWLPLNFYKDGKLLRHPSFSRIDEAVSRLTYNANSSLLDVTLHYGVAGRALFKFTEYLAPGIEPADWEKNVSLPSAGQSGRLSFKYTPRREILKSGGSAPVLGTRHSPALTGAHLLEAGEGPVWGEGGSHDPWKDQGLVPYGEYFENLEEYVSTQTGFLTIIQTDLFLPGRGLDLAIRRIYAPPSTFEGDEPANATDYCYQDYPWAPMGNGWELGFPWIETNNTGPVYIHLSNGQRYSWNGSSQDGKPYHSGEHFTLFNHTNGNYTLYTIDGTRYAFDSYFKLIYIIDPSGNNNVTFSYNVDDKICNITDTIGRNVTFSYNANGLLSNVTSGSRTISYNYAAGTVSGYRLVDVFDPAQRVTKFEYFKDYLIDKTDYPTGGYTSYGYSSYSDSGYTRYRVNEQIVHDGSSISADRTYSYVGNFYSVDKITVEESDGSSVEKTTILEYNQGYFTEKLWDGDESGTKIHEIRKTVDSNRRRILIEMYPGDAQSHIDKVLHYDDWGNLVFSRNFEAHERFLSYTNTDSNNTFVKSNGQRRYGFTDAFYSNSVNPNIHDLIVGMAEFRSGTAVESYYEYSYTGDLTETKQMLSGNWLCTNHTYDKYRHRIKTVNAKNHTTFFEYNLTYHHAYLTSIRQLLEQDSGSHLNLTRSYAYNSSNGLLTCVVDEKGNQTDYTCDILGRITNVTYPEIDGVRDSKGAVYNDTSNMVTIYDENGHMVKHYYDGLARLKKIERYNGSSLYSTESYKYNWLGKVDTWATPGGNKYTYCYDALGKMTKNVNPDGTFTETVYDYTNNKQELRDEEGRRRVLRFDWEGRLTDVKEYNASDNFYHTEYTYDGMGNLVCITDAEGRSTYYHYDQLNRLCMVDYPDGTYEVMDYDNVGNLVLKRDQNGNYSIYQYDSLNRPISIRYYNRSASYSPQQEWLSGWDYRKKITLVGGAGAQTNRSMRVKVYYDSGTDGTETMDGNTFGKVYTASRCRTDFGDIRFTKADGTTLLDYFVHEQANGSYTSIWVELGSIPASPNTTDIYLYYGNSEATTTSECWHEEFTTYTEVDPNSKLTVTTHKIEANDLSRQESAYVYKDFGANYFGSDFVHEVTAYKASGDDNYAQITFWGVANEIGCYNDWSNGIGIYGVRVSNEFRLNIRDTNYSQSGETDWTTLDLDTAYYLTINRSDSTSIACEIYSDSDRTTLVDTLSMTCISASLRYVFGLTSKNTGDSHAGDGYSENLFIRRTSLATILSIHTQIAERVNVTLPAANATFSHDLRGNMVSSKWNGSEILWTYDARNRIVKEKLSTYQNATIVDYNTEYTYDSVGNVVAMRYPDGYKLDFEYDDLNRIKKLGNLANFSYTLESQVEEIDYANALSGLYVYDERGRPISVLLGENVSLEDWLWGWTHRKEITITGSTAGAQTNYTIKFNITYGCGNDTTQNIHCNSHCRSDFGDIRFTNATGALLDYWIESKTDNQSAVFWAEVDSIPASPNTTDIYLYYGNSEATTSARYYEDFTTYTEVDPNSKLTVTTHKIEANDLSRQESAYVYKDFGANYFGSDFVHEVTVSKSSGDDTYAQITFWGVSNEVGCYNDWSNFVGIYGGKNPNGKLRLNIRDDAGNTDYMDLSLDDPHYLTVNRSGGTYTEVKSYSDSDRTSLEGTISCTCVATSFRYVYGLTSKNTGDSHAGDGYSEDLLKITERADPEPTISNIGPESTLLNETDPLLALTYTYDKSGSVVQIYNGSRTETYSYDQLDRLNRTTGPWETTTYKYDEVGNRLLMQVGESSINYVYDIMNRLLQAGSTTYDWDSNGNLVGKSDGVDTWNYTYDQENRLTTVRLNGTVQNRFFYDAHGRRVSLWDSQTGYVNHIYSGLDIIFENSSQGVTKHFYANGLHIAENRSGTVEYYHQDHLGSTRLKTNQTGDIIFSSNYMPFGPAYNSQGTEEFKYTGKHEDSTGLYYFGARYYDPETGRFITADIYVGFDLSNPQTLNRYVYCANNPLKYVDPDGRMYTTDGGGGTLTPDERKYIERLRGGPIEPVYSREETQWYEYEPILGTDISRYETDWQVDIGAGSLLRSGLGKFAYFTTLGLAHAFSTHVMPVPAEEAARLAEEGTKTLLYVSGLDVRLESRKIQTEMRYREVAVWFDEVCSIVQRRYTGREFWGYETIEEKRVVWTWEFRDYPMSPFMWGISTSIRKEGVYVPV